MVGTTRANTKRVQGTSHPRCHLPPHPCPIVRPLIGIDYKECQLETNRKQSGATVKDTEGKA